MRTLERAAPWSPIWPCTRWGFPCLSTCVSSGGLLLHLFTLAELPKEPGGIFSVALSVRTPHDVAARVYPTIRRSRFRCFGGAGYAASRPLVFGLSSSPDRSGEAILRPSKIEDRVTRFGPKINPRQARLPGMDHWINRVASLIPGCRFPCPAGTSGLTGCCWC